MPTIQAVSQNWHVSWFCCVAHPSLLRCQFCLLLFTDSVNCCLLFLSCNLFTFFMYHITLLVMCGIYHWVGHWVSHCGRVKGLCICGLRDRLQHGRWVTWQIECLYYHGWVAMLVAENWAHLFRDCYWERIQSIDMTSTDIIDSYSTVVSASDMTSFKN